MKDDIRKKVLLLSGKDIWHTKETDDLKSLSFSDGPHGIRKQVNNQDHLGIDQTLKATAFPTFSLIGSTFNKSIVREMGEAIAVQAKKYQVHLVLGPGINIKRSPLCGRNFEYLSEDPFLTGELAAQYVQAIEEKGVGTSVKHFFANNQETYRFTMDSIVDPRALEEIYLKAFRRVIKENPASVMAAYNKINGIYATEHPMIKRLLRDELNYQGVVLTDWGAINNPIKALEASCDLVMPYSDTHADILCDAIEKDPKLIEYIESSYQRIKHMIDQYAKHDEVVFSFEDHHQLAKKIANEGVVLLKNDQVLPLKKEESVAFIGDYVDQVIYQGGGSSKVNAYRVSQIRELIKNYGNKNLIAKGFNQDTESVDSYLEAEAINVAKMADKVVLLMGQLPKDRTEGIDRDTIKLPSNQLHLLSELLRHKVNVIVVLLTGSVVELDFDQEVKAILVAHLGGEAISESILETLYGVNNPSGRLAETWITSMDQCPAKMTKDNHSVYYDESIFVGYRHYQTNQVKVKYPFGYGLSYAKFVYLAYQVSREETQIKTQIKVSNRSSFSGSEVIQLYASLPNSKISRAVRELVAFEKVHFEPHEEKQIEITFDIERLKYFDMDTNQFQLEKGQYQIELALNAQSVIAMQTIAIDGYEPSLSRGYNQNKFAEIYGKPLPLRHIKAKRPFHANSTLNDLRETWMGRRIAKQIVKQALKKSNQTDDQAMKEILSKSILETPLRVLSSFGGESLTSKQMKGLIDLANLKVIKGMKQIKNKK